MIARNPTRKTRRVRYAVVGIGPSVQNSVLPSFANARRNSELTALVSDDSAQLEILGRRHGIDALYTYQEYDACLSSGEVDAVYLAMPISMYRPYAVGAARRGVHVLCEKPLAVSTEDCAAMIEAARRSRTRLMTAYRLHFERANTRAVELVKSGRLGEPRLFTSTFTMQVRDGDTRLTRETGGGTLYDIGVHCIHAARHLFGAEPTEVVAVSAQGDDPRASEVEEVTAAALRFPGDRIATFTCSFGAADASAYRLVCTEGSLRVDPAYTDSRERRMSVTAKGRTSERMLPATDRFALALMEFSDAALERRRPGPSADGGLDDVRIIEALYRSAATRKPESLPVLSPQSRPLADPMIARSNVRREEFVHEQPSHED